MANLKRASWITVQEFLPQHFLNFLPLPQVQGSLRPVSDSHVRQIGIAIGHELVHSGLSRHVKSMRIPDAEHRLGHDVIDPIVEARRTFW